MLHLYALLLAETGARSQSEALRLKWEDADLEGGFLFIPSTKGEHRTKSGKGGQVPLTPRLREALREHFAAYRLGLYGGKRTPSLFHHTRTRRRAKAGDRIASFWNAMERAVSWAKLPSGFHIHDLRQRRGHHLASGRREPCARQGRDGPQRDADHDGLYPPRP